MNKVISFIVVVLLIVGVGTGVQAQKVQKSPKSVLTQTVGITDITISYYRPGLKGRSMASLAPNGAVWRTGANNATGFMISNPITIGGKELAAGNYSLWTIPGDGEWTIIINSKHGWGTQYDESGDVMRFKAKATKTAEVTETATINISDIDANGKDAKLEICWGNVSVKAPFTVSQ
ncbi:MAG: DUF2911 domain-containing protein [Bacteroidetes bacterium]|nr:MAG: DUF2911 domain-containing protein [Bacteroidota bacterium]